MADTFQGTFMCRLPGSRISRHLHVIGFRFREGIRLAKPPGPNP